MAERKHFLSNVDPERREADCSYCGGRVSVKSNGGPISHTTGRKRSRWRCTNAVYRGPRGKRGNYRKAIVPKADRCERCGFEPEDLCQLDAHHIDGNKRNNDPSNIFTICSNCHRLIHKRGQISLAPLSALLVS